MPKALKKTLFNCQFCERGFKKYSTLVEHSASCVFAIRKKEENTPESKLAHKLWIISFKYTRRKNYDFKVFIEHRDYKLFKRFADFCIKINALYPEKYMDWCIKERIKIKSWTDETVYGRYIKYYLTHEDPVDAVVRSIDYIKETKITCYFANVQPGTFLLAIEAGRISPWLYLLYGNASVILKRMNQDHIDRLNRLIDSTIWSMLQRKNQAICIDIKKTLKNEIL